MKTTVQPSYCRRHVPKTVWEQRKQTAAFDDQSQSQQERASCAFFWNAVVATSFSATCRVFLENNNFPTLFCLLLQPWWSDPCARASVCVLQEQTSSGAIYIYVIECNLSVCKQSACAVVHVCRAMLCLANVCVRSSQVKSSRVKSSQVKLEQLKSDVGYWLCDAL